MRSPALDARSKSPDQNANKGTDDQGADGEPHGCPDGCPDGEPHSVADGEPHGCPDAEPDSEPHPGTNEQGAHHRPDHIADCRALSQPDDQSVVVAHSEPHREPHPRAHAVAVAAQDVKKPVGGPQSWAFQSTNSARIFELQIRGPGRVL